MNATDALLYSTLGVSGLFAAFAYLIVLRITAQPGASGGVVSGSPGTGSVVPPPTTATPAPVDRFPAAVADTLQWEGGNDDDPRDPGGRTSRGIIQTEWNVWRQTHPGLPSDVWQAPQDQVLAIYRQNYWEAMSCDQLPAGVDYCIFDYGVNSGNSRAAKALQQLVGVTVDGEIGPDTVAATAKMDPTVLVDKLCDQRLAFLKGLGTWATFGKGWTNRVEGVREQAAAMAAGASTSVSTTPATSSTPTLTGGPPWLATMASLDGLHWDADEGANTKINFMLEAIATKFPDMAAYCRDEEKLDYFSWCGLAVAYCMAMNGIRPPYQLGVDTSSFLWAKAWLGWGTPVAAGDVRQGDVIVYNWGHVSLYDHATSGDQFASHGGNQSHMVNVTMFPMSAVAGIRRPPVS